MFPEEHCVPWRDILQIAKRGVFFSRGWHCHTGIGTKWRGLVLALVLAQGSGSKQPQRHPAFTKTPLPQTPDCSMSWLPPQQAVENAGFLLLLFSESEAEQKTHFYLQRRCFSELPEKSVWGLCPAPSRRTFRSVNEQKAYIRAGFQ